MVTLKVYACLGLNASFWLNWAGPCLEVERTPRDLAVLLGYGGPHTRSLSQELGLGVGNASSQVPSRLPPRSLGGPVICVVTSFLRGGKCSLCGELLACRDRTKGKWLLCGLNTGRPWISGQPDENINWSRSHGGRSQSLDPRNQLCAHFFRVSSFHGTCLNTWCF